MEACSSQGSRRSLLLVCTMHAAALSAKSLAANGQAHDACRSSGSTLLAATAAPTPIQSQPHRSARCGDLPLHRLTSVHWPRSARRYCALAPVYPHQALDKNGSPRFDIRCSALGVNASATAVDALHLISPCVAVQAVANSLSLLRWQRHEKPWDRHLQEQGGLPDEAPGSAAQPDGERACLLQSSGLSAEINADYIFPQCCPSPLRGNRATPHPELLYQKRHTCCLFKDLVCPSS